MTSQRVLVVGTRYLGLTAAESASTVCRAWAAAAPHAELIEAPSTDGGPGFLDAVQQLAADSGRRVERRTVPRLGAALTYLVVGDDCGDNINNDGTSNDSINKNVTAYLEAAEAVTLAGSPDTAPVGDLLVAVAREGIDRAVVGVGATACLDGGQGLVRAAAGAAAGATADADADRTQWVRDARTALRGLRITGVVDEQRSLLGFQGAVASLGPVLGMDPAASQLAERGMGEWVDDARAALPQRRDLLTGTTQYDDRVPGSGAGGGLGYGLLTLGAHLVPGPVWWAQRADLDRAVSAADLVVIVQQVFDWQVLDDSVLRVVTDAAARAARPAIVVADEVQVGRRETMSMGLSAAYSVTPPGTFRQTPPDPTTARAELGRLAARLAGTWTPTRPGDVP